MTKQRCSEPVRGGGTCALEPGHKKSHSSVTFYCESCGKRRRGHPHATAPDGEFPSGLTFCFLCVRGLI